VRVRDVDLQQVAEERESAWPRQLAERARRLRCFGDPSAHRILEELRLD
jgi:hypothetical protein